MAADYEYWKQYGFGDYAKEFEKLGIRDIYHLKELAPELEDRYGLDGLCEVLGVVRPPKEEPKPTPAPQPSQKNHKRTQSGDGDAPKYVLVKSNTVSIKTALIIAAVLIVGILLLYFGVKDGLFKGKLSVTLSSETMQIDRRKAELTLIDAGDEHEILSKGFDKEGSAQIKYFAGTYDAYLTYDGQAYYYGRLQGEAMTQKDFTSDPGTFLLRPVLITFRAKDGTLLTPQSASAGWGTDGETGICHPLDGERYLLFLPNDLGEEALTVKADGYAAVSVIHDWGADRLIKMEVTLSNEE